MLPTSKTESFRRTSTRTPSPIWTFFLSSLPRNWILTRYSFNVVLAKVRQVGVRGFERTSEVQAQRSAQPNENFFLTVCIVFNFSGGPCCQHSVFTARLYKITRFGSIFPKKSRERAVGVACARRFWSTWRQRNPTRAWLPTYDHVRAELRSRHWDNCQTPRPAREENLSISFCLLFFDPVSKHGDEQSKFRVVLCAPMECSNPTWIKLIIWLSLMICETTIGNQSPMAILNCSELVTNLRGAPHWDLVIWLDKNRLVSRKKGSQIFWKKGQMLSLLKHSWWKGIFARKKEELHSWTWIWHGSTEQEQKLQVVTSQPNPPPCTPQDSPWSHMWWQVWLKCYQDLQLSFWLDATVDSLNLARTLSCLSFKAFSASYPYYPKEDTADGPHVFAMIVVSPFLACGSTKGTTKEPRMRNVLYFLE